MLAAMMLEDTVTQGGRPDALMEFIEESEFAEPPPGRMFRRLIGLEYKPEVDEVEVVDDMSFNPLAGFPGLAPLGVVGGGE